MQSVTSERATALTPDSPSAKRYAQRAKATKTLREHLPINFLGPEEARPLQVWQDSEERLIDLYVQDVLMVAFTDLEPVDDFAAQRAADNTELALREFGLRMGDLHAFVKTEAEPLVERLRLGLAKMAECPMTDEGDERHRKLSAYWLKLRQALAAALPQAWIHASAVRLLWVKMTPEAQAEAEKIWGPIRITKQSDLYTLMLNVWPGAEIKELDEYAKTEGFWPLGEEMPWAKHQRSYERKVQHRRRSESSHAKS